MLVVVFEFEIILDVKMFALFHSNIVSNIQLDKIYSGYTIHLLTQ